MNSEYIYREQDNSILILSTYECVEIGSKSELLGEFRDKFVCVYARKIIINGDLYCSNMILCANEITSNDKSTIFLDKNKDDEIEPTLGIYVESCTTLEENIQIHVGSYGKVKLITTSQYRKAMIMLDKAYEESHFFNKIYALRDSALLKNDITMHIYAHMFNLYTTYDPENEFSDPSTIDKDKLKKILIDISSSYVNLYTQCIKEEQEKMKSDINEMIEIISTKINYWDGFYSNNLMNKLIKSDRTANKFCQFEQVDSKVEAINLKWFPIVHPVMCKMLLEKYKIEFSAISMVNQSHDIAKYKEIMENFQRVSNMASIFQNISKEITELYKNWETQLFYTFSNEMSSIYDESNIYIYRITQGYDYFGKKETWTPRGSFTLYQAQTEKMLIHFDEIEKEYNFYISESKSHSEKIESLKGHKEKEKIQYSIACKEKIDLEKDLESTLNQIKTLKNELNSKKKVLADGLKKIQETIKNSFGCSAEDVVSSISMCAFAPGSKLLIGSQIADLSVKGFSTVTNAYGSHINKDFLIKKVQSCSKEISSLLTSYKELSDGSIASEDEYNSMILMNNEDILTLLNTLSEIFPDDMEDLKKEFLSFSRMASLQNQNILKYNETLLKILETKSKASMHLENESMLTTILRKEVDPKLPQIVQYMRSMYYEAQRKVIFEIYRQSRAFYYWSLNEITCISEVFCKNMPSNISCAMLRKLQIDLLAEQSNIIESHGIVPQGLEEKGIKIEYSLLEDKRFDLLEKMKKESSITFNISPANKKTTLAKNPFAKRSNVRLIKAIVHLIGASANSDISVDLFHFGEEIICNKYGEEKRFSHDTIRSCCEYSLKNDDAIYVRFDDSNHTYALISPFTFWTISVDKDKHKNLVLEGLTDIKITFYITCESFNV